MPNLTMIELENMLTDIEKMIKKEKGMRNRILLKDAYDSLKKYETSISKGF